VRPTTKAKQRLWVHDLIVDTHAGHVSRDEIVRRLYVLLVELRNRPPIKRSDPCSVPTTADVKARILQLSAADPLMAHQTIAERIGTNIGRVSEVLAGKRV